MNDTDFLYIDIYLFILLRAAQVRTNMLHQNYKNLNYWWVVGYYKGFVKHLEFLKPENSLVLVFGTNINKTSLRL